MGDHSSRPALACGLKQSTRIARRNSPYAIPIRSCSRWGLPCRFRCRSRGALLPHPFTLALSPGPDPGPVGGLLSVALSLTPAEAGAAGRYPAPCSRGARTFLGAPKYNAAARPSGSAGIGAKFAEGKLLTWPRRPSPSREAGSAHRRSPLRSHRRRRPKPSPPARHPQRSRHGHPS